MNRKQFLVVIATASTFAGASALASEIYRNTDENGNVQYTDRPSGDPSEQRMAIVSRPTNTAAVQERASTRYADRDASNNAEAGEDAAGEKKMTRAERAAEKKERDAKCQQSRDRLETYVTSRRLYHEDDNGERVYLDDAEIQEARNKAQELVVENCN